jgi:hypothetical protein
MHPEWQFLSFYRYLYWPALAVQVPDAVHTFIDIEAQKGSDKDSDGEDEGDLGQLTIPRQNLP